jgi:Na+/H+ antiporter NhaC
MKVEILLIINSILVAVCLYFIRDFHKDFKSMNGTVQTLREKFTELSTKFNIHIQTIKERLNKIDKDR